MRIVLASESPRRKAFLEMLGLDFEVMPSGVDERAVKEKDPVQLARELARMKAEEVAAKVKSQGSGDAVVIGADTLVSFEGRVIGKARDGEDAFRILSGYSGKEHTQITGICLISTGTGKVIVDHDETVGRVRDLDPGEIREYVSTGEPMQGAGAYTPRAHAMIFREIEGSWTNIVGMPMEKFVPLLGEIMRG